MKLRNDLAEAPEAEGIKISPLPVLVKALIPALRRHPIINSSWNADNQEIVLRRSHHIGMATDTERGLLVSVVRDADRLSVFDIGREISRLATAARDGSITPAELSGSTITITNLGSFDIESGTPIINYPEAAILAAGTIAMRPWVVGEQIVATCDDSGSVVRSSSHRRSRSQTIPSLHRNLIENPARLLGVS